MEKPEMKIDFIITDKKAIFRDVTVLNQFSTGSDHRIARASIEINLGKKRYCMIKKRSAPTWTEVYKKLNNSDVKYKT